MKTKPPLNVFNTQLFNKVIPKHFEQLQYLPLLYAPENETVYIGRLPQESFIHHLGTLRKLPNITSQILPDTYVLKSWQEDENSYRFAQQFNLDYNGCDPKVIDYFSKKSTCHALCQMPSGCQILHNLEEYENYLKNHEFPILLKEDLNFSGLGHYVINNLDQHQEALDFCQNAFKQGIICAQPLFERVLDFSTQWEISKDREIFFVGETWLLNTSQRGYKGSLVGYQLAKEFGWDSFLQQHLLHAKDLVQNMACQGYFGNVGLDSFIYIENGVLKLFPVVEINARNTMGKVALKWWQYTCKSSMGFLVRQNHDKIKGGCPLNPKKSLWFYNSTQGNREFFEKIYSNYASSFENFHKLL